MDRGKENDRIVNAFDNIVKKELNRVEKELNRFKKRLGKTRLQGSDGNNEKAELWNIAGLLIFGNKSDANNTIQETSEMSSEKSVPGEGAREAELQAAPVTGPSDTSPVTSSAPADNIPEIAEDTAPATSTAQDHNIPEITGDTAPVTTAQDHNIPEIAEDTASVTCTAQDHNIPEIAEDESPVTSSDLAGDTPVMGPSHTSPDISTPPDSTVPEDPANSPSTTPASVSPPGEIKIDSVEIDSVSLSWSSPDNMDDIPHSFKITYSSSDKSHQDSITAPSNSTVISELRPGREYSFTVTTVLKNGTKSMPVSTSVCTKMHFVDEHRFALIQRVVSVETVADALLEKRMLQEAQYDEILAEKVSSAQMRLLYKFTRAWGKSEKDVFLEILKEQQPHLIKDLQGD